MPLEITMERLRTNSPEREMFVDGGILVCIGNMHIHVWEVQTKLSSKN
jgi:hypothetical protein